jgi:hypothetical protein
MHYETIHKLHFPRELQLDLEMLHDIIANIWEVGGGLTVVENDLLLNFLNDLHLLQQ